MIEENGADGAVVPSSKEGQILRRGSWSRCEELSWNGAVEKVDFGEGYILLWVETLRGVGIAQDSD